MLLPSGVQILLHLFFRMSPFIAVAFDVAHIAIFSFLFSLSHSPSPSLGLDACASVCRHTSRDLANTIYGCNSDEKQDCVGSEHWCVWAGCGFESLGLGRAL